MPELDHLFVMESQKNWLRVLSAKDLSPIQPPPLTVKKQRSSTGGGSMLQELNDEINGLKNIPSISHPTLGHTGMHVRGLWKIIEGLLG